MTIVLAKVAQTCRETTETTKEGGNRAVKTAQIEIEIV